MVTSIGVLSPAPTIRKKRRWRQGFVFVTQHQHGQLLVNPAQCHRGRRQQESDVAALTTVVWLTYITGVHFLSGKSLLACIYVTINKGNYMKFGMLSDRYL